MIWNGNKFNNLKSQMQEGREQFCKNSHQERIWDQFHKNIIKCYKQVNNQNNSTKFIV